jgi:ABC-type sugar transport system permease subunit
MELFDAARVDAANEWQILRYVIVPLSKAALGVIAMFAAVYAWNDFLGPLIYLQDESRYTLAIGLQFFRSVHDVQFNLFMGASSLVVLPIVVILAFQRQSSRASRWAASSSRSKILRAGVRLARPPGGALCLQGMDHLTTPFWRVRRSNHFELR